MAEIPTSKAAIKHFEDIGGGRLTRVEVYGTNPLEGHPHLNGRRCLKMPFAIFQNLSVTLSQGL